MYARHSSATFPRSSSGRVRSSCFAARRWKSARSSYGHAEQLADDEAGHREREVGHQVGGRTRLRHRVEVLVDDLGDARLEPPDPLDGELAGEQAPQPGVLGRVEHQQVARALLTGVGARHRDHR